VRSSPRDGNGCARPSKLYVSCWTKPEASYSGDILRFPTLRCDPKPVQPGGPPIFLGAHGPKALERVVRTYDGWCPVFGSAETFKRDVAELRKLAAEKGRDPASLRIMAFASPGEDGVPEDQLKLYAEAGAERIVLFSQRDAIAMAQGQTLKIIRRIAPTINRAARL